MSHSRLQARKSDVVKTVSNIIRDLINKRPELRSEHNVSSIYEYILVYIEKYSLCFPTIGYHNVLEIVCVILPSRTEASGRIYRGI